MTTLTTKFLVVFFGVEFLVGCSSLPRQGSKAEFPAIKKTNVKKRTPTNYPVSPKIAWINHIPQSSGYKFYVGRSTNSKSQEYGILLATQDAYRQSVRENFGIQIRVNIKSLETLKKTSYSKEFNESSSEIKLIGFERRKIHIEREDEVFHVWVLFRYSLKDIKREKERIKNQKTDFIKGVSEYWAGNDNKAMRFFGNACADNIIEACLHKGVLEYDRGNITKAERLWQRVSDKGNAKERLSLGTMEQARGNATKAAKLYQKACNGEELLGCTMLGIIEYERGKTFRAERLWQKACDGEELLGCSRVGIVEYKRGNIAKAARLLKKACDGEGLLCTKLGMLEYLRGNTTKAARLLKKACDDEGAIDACNLLEEGEKLGLY